MSIGGSQVASAIGCNPWRSPIQLWLTLTGDAPEQPDNPAMRWGRLLEPVVVSEYAATVGRSVVVPGEPMYHPTASYRRATVDGLVVDEHGAPEYGLEVKTANSRAGEDWGDPGTDQIPMHYLAQVAWYLHVTNLERWDVAVLIGGQDFRIYTVRRDLEFEERMVELVEAFWTGHVLAQVPPPPDHTREFRQYLERRYPSATSLYLQADEVTEKLIDAILVRQHCIAELEEDNDRARNVLCSIIADASGVDTRHGRVHWKPQRGRTIVDWEKIAREIFDHFALPEVEWERKVASHTRQAKSTRSLRLPRISDKELEARRQLTEDNEVFKGAILGPGGNLGAPE